MLKIDVPHDEMHLFAIPFLQGGHIKTPTTQHRASKLSITSIAAEATALSPNCHSGSPQKDLRELNFLALPSNRLQGNYCTDSSGASPRRALTTNCRPWREPHGANMMLVMLITPCCADVIPQYSITKTPKSGRGFAPCKKRLISLCCLLL